MPLIVVDPPLEHATSHCKPVGQTGIAAASAIGPMVVPLPRLPLLPLPLPSELPPLLPLPLPFDPLPVLSSNPLESFEPPQPEVA